MTRAGPFPLLLPALVALLLAVGAPAQAEEALVVPRADAVRLDGSPDEPSWATALVLPCERVAVPPAPFLGTTRTLAPEVRLLEADGRLWVGVAAAEDPGTSIGVHLLVAGPQAHSAADAASLAYRPVELRAPRYAVRGPRGVGRAHYALAGARRIDAVGHWTLEACVPIADLVGEAREDPLRLAVTVFTRTPNVVASAPGDARWHGPATWLALRPQGGAWGTGSAPDRAALAAEDAADAARRDAWLAWLQANALPLRGERSAEGVRAHARELLLGPLDEMERLQPDLAVPLCCLRGDVHQRLAAFEAAAREFERAARLAPGWREAQYGLHLRVRGPRLAEGEVGGPTDYDAALARVDALAEEARDDRWAAEGLDLARGLLLLKRGDAAAARALLDPLASRYPHDAYVVEQAALARRFEELLPREARRRGQDAARKLPHAFLETSRGTIEIELLEDDAPNTVNNFVWLGRAGFYDGLAFHRTVPFFVVQGGDPLTAEPNAHDVGVVGTGGPGYAIRTETNDRPLQRGVLAMANAGRDTEGSQFVLTTGTAGHLAGDQAVFGKVVRGLDVVDALRQGDRIRGVRFEGLDPERAYRPTTVAGRPAPEPRR